jgi:type IV pilus assembly protein PilB
MAEQQSNNDINLESGAPLPSISAADLDVQFQSPLRRKALKEGKVQYENPLDELADEITKTSRSEMKIYSLESSPFLSRDQIVELIDDLGALPGDLKEKLVFLERFNILPLFIRQEQVVSDSGKKSSPRLCCAVLAENPRNGELRNSSELSLALIDTIVPQLKHNGVKSSKVELLLLDGEDFSHIKTMLQNPKDRLQFLERLPEEVRADQALEQFFRTAIKSGASDIHIEPTGVGDYQIRMRVNGTLQKRYNIDFETAKPLIAQLKIRGDMKVDEKRRPLDGQFKLYSHRSDGTMPDDLFKGFSARCSIVPTVSGEKAVMRLLHAQRGESLNLDSLGFKKDVLTDIVKLMQSPNGIVLVTGPTGSGKTTALYSILDRLNTGETNIVTVEDPVEVPLPGIAQVQVDKAIGRTFSAVLRAFMRQDPDIMLVGEVRDQETAEISVQAALTGHQVYATLHTNDSFGTIARLRDLHVEDSKLQDTIRGVIAQRLVRSLCNDCKESYDAKDELNYHLRESEEEAGPLADSLMLYKPNGKKENGQKCECCQGTGYDSRFPIAEVWVPTPKEKDVLMRGDMRAEDIRRLATDRGMKTMMHWALEDLIAGRTSFAECLKIFSSSEFRIRKEEVLPILQSQRNS